MPARQRGLCWYQTPPYRTDIKSRSLAVLCGSSGYSPEDSNTKQKGNEMAKMITPEIEADIPPIQPVSPDNPMVIDAAEVRCLKAEGIGGTEIAKKMGISRASVYRVLEG